MACSVHRLAGVGIRPVGIIPLLYVWVSRLVLYSVTPIGMHWWTVHPKPWYRQNIYIQISGQHERRHWLNRSDMLGVGGKGIRWSPVGW